MDNLQSIINNNSLLLISKAKEEILACNEFSQNYELVLNEKEAEELVQHRITTLKDLGRVEFGEGILPKLIYAFCDSPFIEKRNYFETLIELQEAFYFYKNESLDLYSDDELIDFMVMVFNSTARGSTEYLIETSLKELCDEAKNSYYNKNSNSSGEIFHAKW